VLSAQFMTAATGRPRAIENLLPEGPFSLPIFDAARERASSDEGGHFQEAARGRVNGFAKSIVL
jgi:hypothetical protein